MKSNILVFNAESAVGTVTLTTCLMKQSSASTSNMPSRSEVHPPESPSESIQRLLQVQWDLPSTVTLGKNPKVYSH